MPSAFISYAHEDQEFVLALAEHLRAQEGLEIRYDQVVLHIGDSLIRVISREIAEGDFLIAVVSPDSVESEWCQTELALAKNQGINERRVKVLPVKYREASMPAMLGDAFYADADRFDLEMLARRLVAAMMAQMEGRDEVEAADAVEPPCEEQLEPVEPVAAGEGHLAQIDAVAEKVFDLLLQWERCRVGSPTVELVDKQRRLRWEFDKLPERLREALPFVGQLTEADWNEFFRGTEPAVVEPDLREELRSMRTQVVQGLPVTRRWTIDAYLGPIDPGNRDAIADLWQIRRGDETLRIAVYLSGTAVASADEGLPREVVQAKATKGRTAVSNLLALDDPPREVMVSTAGVGWPLPA